MIGYYHTWNNDGNPFIKLRDVDKNWDVINISFAEPEKAGSTDGKMSLIYQVLQVITQRMTLRKM